MGYDEQENIIHETQKQFSWEDINQHDKNDDKWIVIDNKVYDITKWVYKHPGGKKILDHFAGHDATMAYKAFHINKELVEKYMRPLCLGSVRPDERVMSDIDKDFEELRDTATKMGLFKRDPLFFFLYLAHFMAIEAVAYTILYFYGSQTWIPFLIATFIFGTAQVTGGWLQHDFGHLSVLRSMKWDHFWQQFTVGFLKGASSTWWNNMHNQHHAKPNVMKKDPDVRIDPVFVVGNVMPIEVAKDRKHSMPYNLQHLYFHLVTPLLFPIYFQVMIFRFCILRKEWKDLAWMVSFYVRFALIYYPVVDSLFTLWLLYFLMRCIESMWFTWVSQSNHIPMIITNDQHESWVTAQMHGTCNIEGSWFNDWFTGHLNYQIEHHFFPTMPRNKLYKITPYAKALCEKHHLPFHVKTMSEAFMDILKTLRKSGKLWLEAFRMYHGK